MTPADTLREHLKDFADHVDIQDGNLYVSLLPGVNHDHFDVALEKGLDKIGSPDLKLCLSMDF